MKKFLVVILALVSAAAFSTLISCSGSGKSPADVSKSFMLDIEKGDLESAIQLMDGSGEATEEEMQKMKELLGEGSRLIEEKGGIRYMDVVSEGITDDGTKAEVKLKITYGNGEVEDSNATLINTEDGWKVTLAK